MRKPDHSATARQRKHRAAESAIERRPCADPARRARLEKDAVKWLLHYMPAAFSVAMSPSHKAIIKGAVQSAKSGTGIAVAAPRGEGKTTVLRGVCLYLVSTGVARFPVLAGWTHKAATEGFRVWLRMLHASPEFQADYPELCQPFEDSTHSARIKNLTWQDTGAECGAEVRAVDRCIVLPDSRGAIAAASVQGDVKGLSVTLPNGEIIRPDILLLDDAQDPKRAGNSVFVAGVVETIEKQWMCLAGPMSRITTMVACTVAAPDDVSEHFLNRPDFQSIRVSRVVSWPAGWEDAESETRKLWDFWHGELLDGLADGDGGVRGRKFYRERKAQMTAGMAVSWRERFDKKRHDPDAMYSAMFDFYRIGPAAFASEYQNKPLPTNAVVEYTLRAEDIVSKTNGLPRGKLPDSSKFLAAGIDLNRAGASWIVLSASQTPDYAIIDYGRWLPPGRKELWARSDKASVEQAIAATVDQVVRMLLSKPYAARLDAACPDAGSDWARVVHDASKSLRMLYPTCKIWAAKGTDGFGYNPPQRTALIRQGYLADVRRKAYGTQQDVFMFWDSSYWHMATQQGWLAGAGATGALSVFGEPGTRHQALAFECAADRLDGVEYRGDKKKAKWTETGDNHYGDALAIAAAALSVLGVLPTGIRDGARPKVIDAGPGTQPAAPVPPVAPTAVISAPAPRAYRRAPAWARW